MNLITDFKEKASDFIEDVIKNIDLSSLPYSREIDLECVFEGNNGLIFSARVSENAEMVFGIYAGEVSSVFEVFSMEIDPVTFIKDGRIMHKFEIRSSSINQTMGLRKAMDITAIGMSVALTSMIADTYFKNNIKYLDKVFINNLF